MKSSLDPAKVAIELRELHNITSFPVYPHIIARLMGIKVFEVMLMNDVSGALKKEKGNEPIIYLNRNDSVQRKRFSIAHELGHYMSRVLTDGDDEEFEFIDFRDDNSSNGSDPEEVFANKFAAELLMPEKEVRRLYKKGGDSVSLSDYFHVSAHAMSIRLNSLGLKRVKALY